ncbi:MULTISPECIES: sensor histidine kinase [unclassified Pseudomonas]|uniref:sensor histidine kinase n=1 Tax=unclassified Pseudomonas TaxID=196821 RepID=UPI0025F277F7|nr:MULTISPECIES: HAMP domain-containing sensor histidine kinase [unclassified Pseudomonas]
MTDRNQGLDFSMVIASTVHDMKNSLASLIQAHGEWVKQLPEADRGTSKQGVIDYEFAHLNGMLVQLLGLYKLGVNQLPLRPDYHELDDFIEAQLALHREVLNSRGIAARYEVDDFDLPGFFDRELVGSVVSNVLINAIRFAREQVLITAGQVAEQVVISINDDGPGFPEQMIAQQSDYVLGIDQSSGSTGLGLYFAANIARQHQRQGMKGHIEIANGGQLGGGLFRIYLP